MAFQVRTRECWSEGEKKSWQKSDFQNMCWQFSKHVLTVRRFTAFIPKSPSAKGCSSKVVLRPIDSAVFTHEAILLIPIFFLSLTFSLSPTPSNYFSLSPSLSPFSVPYWMPVCPLGARCVGHGPCSSWPWPCRSDSSSLMVSETSHYFYFFQ